MGGSSARCSRLDPRISQNEADRIFGYRWKAYLRSTGYSLIRENAHCEDDICKQERVQLWFRRAILGNTRLKKAWSDVSASIIAGEGSPPTDILDDLCDGTRHETRLKVINERWHTHVIDFRMNVRPSLIELAN